jgi:myo-inositol-1(or 4)-monophosphatase
MMDTALQIMSKLAREAGALLIDYFHRAELQSSFKSDRSVVTEADLAADYFITQAIQQQFPGEQLLSEEINNTLPAPAEVEGDQAAWIVDPLDGTTNFSLGLHTWGILLTRCLNGWPQTTVMYFPLLDELYTAQRGGGALLNDSPIQVYVPTPGRTLAFFTCCSRTHRQYQVSLPYKVRILGSAAYSFCLVARGAAIVGFEATPKIWDIAGPWLLVQEAGGIIETYDNSHPFPLHSGVSFDQTSFPMLAAPSAALIMKARQEIKPR